MKLFTPRLSGVAIECIGKSKLCYQVFTSYINLSLYLHTRFTTASFAAENGQPTSPFHSA